MSETISSFIRMKAQTLVDSLSELMVDASLGTIQCLEEIVSNSLLLSSTIFCAFLLKRNGNKKYNVRQHLCTYH